MKTILIDNSLCTQQIPINTNPDYVYKYIQSLSESGVRYVEIDYSTVMMLEELPENVNFIFRLRNPICADLADAFDFSYTSVTISDLQKRLHISGPIILELPAMTKISPQLIHLAQSQLDGKISMIRLCGNYQMMDKKEMQEFALRLKNCSAVPIDICPMNKFKTALDMAVKATSARFDSITLSMGGSKRFAGLEEYFLTLMSLHELAPEEINTSALCRASIFHKIIFGAENGNSISEIMKILDYDLQHLLNVDTGTRVKMPIKLKDCDFLQRDYSSAMEKMLENEEIPEDIAADMKDAIYRFDASIFKEDILNDVVKGYLQ